MAGPQASSWASSSPLLSPSSLLLVSQILCMVCLHSWRIRTGTKKSNPWPLSSSSLSSCTLRNRATLSDPTSIRQTKARTDRSCPAGGERERERPGTARYASAFGRLSARAKCKTCWNSDFGISAKRRQCKTRIAKTIIALKKLSAVVGYDVIYSNSYLLIKIESLAAG